MPGERASDGGEHVEYAIIARFTKVSEPLAGPVAAGRVAAGAGSRAIDAALCACLVLAPALPSGPRYLGWPPLSYVELLVPLLLVVWAAARAEAGARRPAAFPIGLTSWHLLIAAIGGATVLALMAEHRLDSPVFLRGAAASAGELFRPMNQASHPFYALRVGLTFVEGWLVVLLIGDICRRAADPARRARLALAGWLGGFALVSGFALVQYLTRFQLHPYWVKANPHIVRAHSTLDDPNALGAYLVLGIGLLAGMLLLGGARRRLTAGLLVLGLVALMTTMSRAAIGAAFLGTVGALAVLPHPATALQRRARSGGRVVLGLVMAMLAVSGVLRLMTTERTRTQPRSSVELAAGTLDPRESMDWVLRGRVAWWQASLDMFREAPATGQGLGRVPRLMSAYGGGRIRENTHNLFLQMFAETGLPGGIAFVLLCAGLLAVFVRKVHAAASDETRAVAFGGLIATAAFLMTLLTGHMLLLPSGQLLWAGFIVLAAGLATWGEPGMVRGTHSGGATASRPPSRGLMYAAALAVMLWYPAMALMKGTAPSFGYWGYTWGLYGEEVAAPGVSYRWTSGHASLDLEVPPGTTAIEWPIAAPSPVREGEPVRLAVRMEDHQQEVIVDSPDVRVVHIPVPRSQAAGARLTIDFDVHPTFVPAHHQPPSGDTRVLGVQLLRPRFVTSDPVSAR